MLLNSYLHIPCSFQMQLSNHNFCWCPMGSRRLHERLEEWIGYDCMSSSTYQFNIQYSLGPFFRSSNNRSERFPVRSFWLLWRFFLSFKCIVEGDQESDDISKDIRLAFTITFWTGNNGWFRRTVKKITFRLVTSSVYSELTVSLDESWRIHWSLCDRGDSRSVPRHRSKLCHRK